MLIPNKIWGIPLMKSRRLFFVLCLMTLTACNLVYRTAEDRLTAGTNELAAASDTEIMTIPTETVRAEQPDGCVSRTDWLVYVVLAGDTLSGIAVRSGSTVAELAAANCIANPHRIMEGQRIYVRRVPTAPTSGRIPPVDDRENVADEAFTAN
jgi:hypothetical protein